GVGRPAGSWGGNAGRGGGAENVWAGSMKRARLMGCAGALTLLGVYLTASAQAPVQIGPPVQITPKAKKPAARPKPLVHEKKPAAKTPAPRAPAAKAPPRTTPAAKTPAAPAAPADNATSYAPAPPPPVPAPPTTIFGEPTDRPATVADLPPPDANTAYVAFQAGRFLSAFAAATRRVEEKGDAKAMTLLGELYAEGYGIPRDDAKAVAWYSLAAD